MEFPVPQFIEMETKIVGPFTWRQFIFVGGAGVIIFFLYFILKKTFLVFLIIAFLLGGTSFILAFVKVGGRPLPNVLFNYIIFSFSARLFVWRKKPIRAALVYRKERVLVKKEEKKEEFPMIKVGGRSRLRSLSNQIELKTK